MLFLELLLEVGHPGVVPLALLLVDDIFDIVTVPQIGSTESRPRLVHAHRIITLRDGGCIGGIMLNTVLMPLLLRLALSWADDCWVVVMPRLQVHHLDKDTGLRGADGFKEIQSVGEMEGFL